MGTTAAGLVVLGMSLALGLGAAGFLSQARAMRPPDEPARRALAGTVVEVVAAPCFVRGGEARQTCYRSVVSYTDGGEAKQVAGRTLYHPARHARGQSAAVAVLADGTAWIASELDEREAEGRREHASRQGFPRTMGWVLGGCAVFAALLGIALIFWVDRSDDTPPARTVS
jgi:hypothetical protein